MLAIQRREARQFVPIGAAFTVLLAALTPANAQSPGFDGRGWAVGHRQSNGVQLVTEYVLPGQNVENWRELVTSHVFSPALPLPRFVERLLATLSDGCPSLVWNVIRQDEKTLIYEWHDSGCGGWQPQHELGRITIEDGNLYRLTYATRSKGPLPPEKRNAWLEIFARAPLAEGTIPAPVTPAEPSALTRMRVTRALADRVHASGLPCPSGRTSELKAQEPGPAGPLLIWLLECTNGAQYTVMVDPSGALTAFPASK